LQAAATFLQFLRGRTAPWLAGTKQKKRIRYNIIQCILTKFNAKQYNSIQNTTKPTTFRLTVLEFAAMHFHTMQMQKKTRNSAGMKHKRRLEKLPDVMRETIVLDNGVEKNSAGIWHYEIMLLVRVTFRFLLLLQTWILVGSQSQSAPKLTMVLSSSKVFWVSPRWMNG